MSWFREEKWARLEQVWATHDDRLTRKYKDFHIPKSTWAVVREKDEDEQPWMWTPRRSIMRDQESRRISQNPKRRWCVEDYEAGERNMVKRLRIYYAAK